MYKELINSVVKSIDGLSTGESSHVKNWIGTGNYALNKIVSGDYQKGLPLGRVVDVFGDPSTGKSLLIYHVLANVQKLGGIAILDDTEDAYTKEFGECIGIDNSELIRLSSLTVEEHFEKIFLDWKDKNGKKRDSVLKCIFQSNLDCFVVIALDSLALLSTRHEQGVQFEKPDMVKAKQIRAGLRMTSDLMKGNVLHLISNHVTAKFGVLYGPRTTTPGGTGVPFQAAVRIELSKGAKIENPEGQVIGIESDVYITKNKVAAPFKKTTLQIYFDRGVDSKSGLLESFVENNIVKAESKHFVYKEETFRKSEFGEFLVSHPELLNLK